jgi:hypothetical protein
MMEQKEYFELEEIGLLLQAARAEEDITIKQIIVFFRMEN